jgi:hypothetical protein
MPTVRPEIAVAGRKFAAGLPFFGADLIATCVSVGDKLHGHGGSSFTFRGQLVLRRGDAGEGRTPLSSLHEQPALDTRGVSIGACMACRGCV